jgi:hypothetical protein
MSDPVAASSTGCIVCGAPVEFPEYTLLCNTCDEDNLKYAEEQHMAEKVIFKSETITPESFTRVTINGTTVDIEDRAMVELVKRWLSQHPEFLLIHRRDDSPARLKGLFG